MAVNLDNSSMISSWMTQTGMTAVSSAKNTSLEGTLQGLSSETDDARLLEACKSFETYLVEQVYKEMEKTVGDEEDENEYLACFGDTLIQEYAKSATEQCDGFGIAKMLYEQMKQNYGLDTSIESGDDVKETLNSSNKSFENKS